MYNKDFLVFGKKKKMITMSVMFIMGNTEDLKCGTRRVVLMCVCIVTEY